MGFFDAVKNMFGQDKGLDPKQAVGACYCMALADGTLSVEEKSTLSEEALKLGMSQQELDQLIANPDAMPGGIPESPEQQKQLLAMMEQIALADGTPLCQMEMATIGQFCHGMGISGPQIASRCWDPEAIEFDASAAEKAIMDNDVERLEELVTNAFAANWLTENGKWTFLTLAGGKGSNEAFDYLLEQGAIIDGICPYLPINANAKRPALCTAAVNLNWDMGKRLIDGGAIIDFADNELEATPLYQIASNAAYWGQLLNSQEIDADRYKTAMDESEAFIDALLEGGADINAANGSDGFRPLAIAIQDMGSDPRIPLYLINKGADFNLTTPQGANAMDLANEHGHDVIAEALTAKSGGSLQANLAGGSGGELIMSFGDD